MTDCRYTLQSEVIRQPAKRFIDQSVQVVGNFGAQGNIGNGRAFDDMQLQRRPSQIDDAPAQSHRLIFGHPVQAELDGR